jgi:uncharacterized metal-binding protein
MYLSRYNSGWFCHSGDIVHTPANKVLLTLVTLRRLVVVSRLLLLRGLPLSTVVELAWSVLAISLGTTVGIVSRFTTSETSITTSGSRGVVSHRCARRSALPILREVGTLHRLAYMLSLRLLLTLLVEALVLTLPEVDILSS